jgi:apolipoprotein N-acyltransferase
VAALSLTLLSALLYGALFAPFAASFVGWVAIAPLFYALAAARPLRAAALGGVFGLGITAVVIAWIVPTARDYFGVSTATALGFLLLVCLNTTVPYYAAVAGALAALRSRLGDTAWWLLVPAAWVTAEYARSELGLRSSWGLLGDAWSGSGALRQIADCTGIYGVSAVVAVANAAIAAIARSLIHRRAIAGPLRVAAVAAAAVAVSIAYGTWRIGAVDATPADPHGALHVALVQGNVPQSLRWNRVHASRVLRAYGQLTREAIAAGGEAPDLVVWPESALQTELADPTYGPPLRALVDRAGVPVLAGIPRSEEDHHYNSALLLAPGGSSAYYDKVRLLPFVERWPWRPIGSSGSGARSELEYSAGRELGLFRIRGRPIGVLICLEVIDPDIARATLGAGAEALFNLSNDGWYANTPGVAQHFAKAVYRAIENRVPVVRATATGITAVIDPSGTVRERLRENETAVLHAAVPSAWPPSFYRRFGDVFAIACCLAFAMAGAVAVARAINDRGGRPEGDPVRAPR